jgi:hypothetical protein
MTKRNLFLSLFRISKFGFRIFYRKTGVFVQTLPIMRMAATKMFRPKTQRRKEMFLFFVTVTQE